MNVMIGILIFTLSVYLILRELEEDWDVEMTTMEQTKEIENDSKD